MDPNDTSTIETPETPEVEPETSLRDDIESSLAELTPQETPEPAAEQTPEPAVTPREDGRDEKGRFVSKSKPVEPAGAADAAGGEQPAGAPTMADPAGTPSPTPAPAPEPVERAPQSWKPLAREAWAKIPAEARQEVIRREAEVQRVLQESAAARRTYSEFQETIRPYEAMIRSEAGDPIRAVQGLLDTAYKLRTAPQAQKAQIIATLIQGYGVDVPTLDEVLAGAPVSQRQAQGPIQDPRVDQLFAQMQQAQQAQQEQSLALARQQLEEATRDLEFFEDVREEVADILEVAGRRGQKLTIKQAYERALTLSEEHQKILKQREAAKRAPAVQAQVQRAKAAAASVPSRPTIAPPRTNQGTSLREDLEETLRELQGRQS